MTRSGLLTPLLLALAVMASALLVVKTKHDNRRLTTELDQLRAERGRLDSEWAQLQLEEATLAHHGRVEQIARDKLDMAEPRDHRIVKQAPGLTEEAAPWAR
ncbi:MAG: cell division protein FtsL [Gammaproteobacteria bacterium]|nr:cell division protein FtsL [Gammaproteobacteria bacterium]